MASTDKFASASQVADLEVGSQEISAFTEERLYTAVVSDALDQIGIRNQAMREYLRPLFPTCKFAGWARTIACSDVYHISDDPYELEIEAMDSILPGKLWLSPPSSHYGMHPGGSCYPLRLKRAKRVVQLWTVWCAM